MGGRLRVWKPVPPNCVAKLGANEQPDLTHRDQVAVDRRAVERARCQALRQLGVTDWHTQAGELAQNEHSLLGHAQLPRAQEGS